MTKEIWRVTANKAGLPTPITFDVPIESNCGEFIQVLIESGFISFQVS
jgi:hypothetical protein